MIRVMLIDDHPVVRAGLRTILDSFEDISVVAEASNGANIDTEGIDVVVTDIQMPGTSALPTRLPLPEDLLCSS